MIIKKINFWALSILLVQVISLQGMKRRDALVCGQKSRTNWSNLPYEIQKKICKYAGLFEKYRCVREISGSKRFGDHAALSPSGEKWACVLPDGNIVIGDIQGDKIIGSYERNKIIGSYSFERKCIGLAWHPSGNRLLVSFPDIIRELEVQTGTDIVLHYYRLAISSAVSPSQRKIVSACVDGNITIYERNGSCIASKNLPYSEKNTALIAWSPTGERIVFSRGGSGIILMYDEALNLSNTYPSGGEVTSLCCSPEEIIAGLKDGNIDVWNRKSGEVETLSGDIEVKSLVSPSKGRIVSLSEDGIKHWSRKWIKPIRRFVFAEGPKKTWQTVNLLKVWLLEHYLSNARAKGRRYKLTPEMVMYFKILSDEMQAGYKDTIEMP